MTPPLPSRHRLARLLVWARLWLIGLGGVIVQLLRLHPERADIVTRSAARLMRDLVIFHALHRVRRPKYKPCHRPVRTRAGRTRAFIGVRLHKRLAARDPIARFFAILALLRDFDAEVTRFARRLAHGMTRLYSKRYAWADETIVFLAPRPAVPANTS